MRLAVNLSAHDVAVLAREAERLGYEAIFVPEGFTADSVSVLGLLAGVTERIAIAAGVWEIPARTPVMTAMSAATLDTLSGGRFRLGLGLANAYVSEGWHGASFAAPIARIREYVSIVRQVLSRETVAYEGCYYQVREPFRLSLAAVADRIPVYLAAIGPASLRTTGEIADGWFGVFCSPSRVASSVEFLRVGRDRASQSGAPPAALPELDAVLSVPIVIDADIDRAAQPVRRYIARFMSLGPRQDSFYNALLADYGFVEAAREIWERAHAGDFDGAAAAVPLEFVAQTALVGSPEAIGQRMADYFAAGASMLSLSPLAPALPDRIAALATAMDALATLKAGRGTRQQPGEPSRASYERDAIAAG